MGVTAAKLKLLYGLVADTLCGGNVNGNGSVFSTPFDALINGVENSGGCGLK